MQKPKFIQVISTKFQEEKITKPKTLNHGNAERMWVQSRRINLEFFLDSSAGTKNFSTFAGQNFAFSASLARKC